MKMEQRTFRIGELANHLELEQCVIRFWEKEFNVQSQRTEGGQRYYTAPDIERFKLIKELLYKQGLTIAGAKKYLHNNNNLFLASATTPLKATDNNDAPSEKTIASQEKLYNNDALCKQLQELKGKLKRMHDML